MILSAQEVISCIPESAKQLNYQASQKPILEKESTSRKGWCPESVPEMQNLAIEQFQIFVAKLFGNADFVFSNDR